MQAGKCLVARRGGGGCSEGEESSDPTQHAEGRTGDCPGPVKKQQPDGMSHREGDVSAVHHAVRARCIRFPRARTTFSFPLCCFLHLTTICPSLVVSLCAVAAGLGHPKK